MDIVFFAAGAAFGAIEYMAARKIFRAVLRPGWSALYIIQLLILSFGLLALMMTISERALLASAIGLVATSIALAVIFNLKR